MQSIKMVVVGDGGTGKSCLLISYTTSTFPREYVPTVFDNFSANVMFDGQPYQLGLWDTAGQEDYDRLRPLSYPQTDVFMVTFAVDNPDSLANVREKWHHELQHHSPDVPWVLVGCKSDLGSPASSAVRGRCVIKSESSAMATELGAAAFVMTSALTQEGVKSAFDLALRVALSGRQNRCKSSRLQRWLGPNRPNQLNRLKQSDDTLPPRPVAPEMPEAGRAPWIHPNGATLAQDYAKLFRDGSRSIPEPDCIIDLKCSDLNQLYCHRAILAAACPGFERSFRALQQRAPVIEGESPWAATVASVGPLSPVGVCASTSSTMISRSHLELECASKADEAPDDLRCPLSLEVFVDPVICADGHTYEREAIEGWLLQNRTSPITREAIDRESLAPNHVVRKLVSAWRTTTRGSSVLFEEPSAESTGVTETLDNSVKSLILRASPMSATDQFNNKEAERGNKQRKGQAQLVLDPRFATAAATKTVVEWLYTGEIPAHFPGRSSVVPSGPEQPFSGTQVERQVLRDTVAAAAAFTPQTDGAY